MEFKNYQLSQKSYDIDPVQYSALLSEAWLEETSFKSLLTNNSVSIIPFPEIKGSELRVWQAYCPTKQKIQEYRDFIPVEALEILRDHKHHFELWTREECIATRTDDAVEWTEIMWGYISIWSEAKEVIDPILVGTFEVHRKYSWGWSSSTERHYLLAQWGEALKPFEDIYKIVKERLIEWAKMTLQSQLKKVNGFIGSEELAVLQYLNCKSNEILPYELRGGNSDIPF